jgi:hypothetical protein
VLIGFGEAVLVAGVAALFSVTAGFADAARVLARVLLLPRIAVAVAS